MPFRRNSYRGRSSSRFSRFKRRRGPHVPTETKRFERTNFWQTFIQQVGNSSDTCFNLALLLASVQNVSRRDEPFGRALAQQVRGIEVNGLVLNYHIEPVEQNWPAETGFRGNPVTNELYARYGLYSDRLTADGAPVGLTATRWQDSQSPVSQVTGGLPPSTAEDTDFPMRVHWHKQEYQGYSIRTFAPVDEVLHMVDGQRVRTNKHGQINKRLKLFLTDDVGLFWCWSFITGTGYGTSAPTNYRVHISGAVYTRVRY